MVEYPPGEPQDECAICGEPFERYDPAFAAGYANVVCVSCDDRAVTPLNETPEHATASLDEEASGDDDTETVTIRAAPDVGVNPVFIEGQKCWRRYRFGGWITRRDDHDCGTLHEFHETHRNDR